MFRPEYIQGAGGGKGGGGRTATEASDTLRSTQTAEVLDLVSEGPIQGLVNGLKSVYLDGVPVQAADGTANFQGVEFGWTLGTQGQAALHGFDLVQNEVAVALKVEKATPITRSIAAGPDTVRVTVSIPQLSFQDKENGDLKGNVVEYAIELQSNGGGFVEVYRNTIDGKTMSTYKRATLVKLTGAPAWELRVRRISDDSTQSNSVNAIYWDSYTEIQTATLRYPNSAVHGLRVDAQHFGRVPVRGYDILGRVVQVPANYNPITRAYTGLWDGTFVPAWTNNPAWVFYDLVTHPRYGLGQYVQAANINKWRLYQIAQYCDELVPDGRGGQEPRFACNLYLQTQADAYRTLQDLVAVFRGILLYANGTVDVVQDAPSDALSLFTPSNVIDGNFVYQGTSERTRHSGVIVWWNNLANQGKREPELYQDGDLVARYGVRNLELSPLGTWSRGQAVRLAKWALYSEEFEGEVVTFGVGSEGALVGLGRVFKIADPAVAGERLGGRVVASQGLNVTLDRALVLTAGEAYTLTLTLPAGDDPFDLTSETRNVLGAHDGGRTLELDSAFSVAPPLHAIWMLESTAVAATTWRCIAVREVAGEDRYEITGVAHSPQKYALIEQGLKLESKPISRLKPGAVAPTGLVITETVYTAGGAAWSRLNIAWVPAQQAMLFRVAWRLNGGAWTVMPDTAGQNVEISDVMPGTVQVSVRAVNALGAISTPLEGSYIVGGKTQTGDVTGLVLVVGAAGVEARWAAPTGVDGATWAETELRLGESFAAGTVLFKGRATSFALGWKATGALTVWACHSDTSGNVSAPISASLAVAAPGQPTVSASVDATVVRLSWGDCKTTQPISYYLLRRGAVWDTGLALGRISALMATLLEVDAGVWSFWVAAVDMGGNVGAPGFVSVTVGSKISSVLETLNSGLADAVSGINGLGQDIGVINGEIQSPVTGLQALRSSTDMLALAWQQAREYAAALDLSQLLALHKTDGVIRDAGITTDPATGQVKIFGVEQTATQLSQVQADFNALSATITLQAQRITQLNTDLVNAQLDPTGAAVVSGVITQINTVQATLDAVSAELQLKASSATVGDHYLVLQQAVQTLSSHGSDLLVIAQTVNALQNDLAAADNRIVVLEHSASATTEVLAARLALQAKDEIQDAATLAAMLTGEAGKQSVVQQLAHAKTELQASVATLGQSTAQSLTSLAAVVGANQAQVESTTAALANADTVEALARQTLAAKQQTDTDTLTASVQGEMLARTTAVSAEASARQTLAAKQQADHNTVSASVQTETLARSTADAAEATARQTLEAKQTSDHGVALAAVNTETGARVAGDQAQASALLAVQADLNGTIATISQRLAVVVNSSGQVVAAYTLALNANGRVIGMRLDNNGTIGNFVVQADKFAFSVPGANAEVPVFVAGQVGGQNTFGINGQLVVDGSILARAISVSMLSAITANLGRVTAGQLDLAADQTGLGTDWGFVRSYGKWWADGANGWLQARHPDGSTMFDVQGGSNRIWLSSWGDCGIQFPGISMTSAGLVVSQANVIDTLQLAGESVTVPVGGIGYGSIPSYSVVMRSAGKIMVMVSANALAYDGSEASLYVRATCGGASGPTLGISLGPSYSGALTAVGYFPVAAGTYTVSGVASITVGNRTIGDTSIFAIGCMR